MTRTPDGLRRTNLTETAGLASRYGSGTNTTAIVIVSEGRIVAEDYAAGFGMNTPQRTWSVAKSIAATILERPSIAAKQT